MVKVFPRLVESLRGKLPVRTVRLVPGEFFFTRSLDLPPGILPSDIHSFAEFSLESLSPFPMEQLSWGFLTLPGSPNILVYGAYRETLIRNGFTDLEKDSHVYPGFIVGTPREFTEPSVEFRLFDTTLSAIGFAPRNAVPQWVTSARLPDSESTGDPVKAARQRLLNNIDSSAYAVSDATLEITGEVEESNEGWQFPATYRIDGTPPSPEDSRSLGLRLDEHGAWFADIRDDTYIRKKRKENDLARKIWFATLAVGIAAGICLLMHIGFFGMGFWIKNRAEFVVAQTEAFIQLSDTNDRVEKIEQFVQKELRPFDMLETMNVERPSAVHFTEADTDGFNRLSVKGIGTNVEAFNRYTEALRQSPKIETVDPQVRTSQGRALFTLTIIFRDPSETSPSVVAGTRFTDSPGPE